jgi:hypothetical protein
MNDFVDRYLETKRNDAFTHALAGFAELVPAGVRRALLREVYGSFRDVERARKSQLCTEILAVLSQTEGRPLFEDHYFESRISHNLTTIRLKEYIRGRNRRVKDDLLWASMFVGLKNGSASQSLRTRIVVVIREIEQRLNLLTQVLNENYVSDVTEDDLPIIIEKALRAGEPTVAIATILKEYAKVEVRQPTVRQEQRAKIVSIIERMWTNHFRGTLLDSQAVRDSAATRLEHLWMKQLRIDDSAIIQCALRAIDSHNRMDSFSGRMVIRDYAARVERLTRERGSAPIEPFLRKYADQVIRETVSLVNQ